jgi:CheY-like chemotaxis protein
MAQFNRLGSPTVLVVEDSALVQLELVDWLSELGLIVYTANDADEAIAVLEAHPEIDRLLTDIRMPGSMDGIRLAHYVAGRWPPVQIVVLSANFGTSQSDLPPESIFVPKPYLPETLLRALSWQRPTTGRPGRTTSIR